MGSGSAVTLILYRGLFLGLGLVVLFYHLLPFGLGRSGWPGPDILTALIMAWVMRRPDFAPVLAIAALAFLADLLFLKPLGLWAAIMVVGTEFLRRREPVYRELPFFSEWLLVSVVLSAMTVANALILGLFGVSQPGFGLVLIQLIVTLLVYPLAAGFSAFAMGVRKLTPAEAEKMRRRI